MCPRGGGPGLVGVSPGEVILAVGLRCVEVDRLGESKPLRSKEMSGFPMEVRKSRFREILVCLLFVSGIQN